MTRDRTRRLAGAALVLALALAGCAVDPAPGPDVDPAAAGPADTRVVESTGLDTDLPSFTVRRQGRLMQVQFYQAGGGEQRIVVMARSGRGVDRADARAAYDAAFAAAQMIDCGAGRPLLVYPDSATFQEEDRRTALTQGGPAWLFQGRCG